MTLDEIMNIFYVAILCNIMYWSGGARVVSKIIKNSPGYRAGVIANELRLTGHNIKETHLIQLAGFVGFMSILLFFVATGTIYYMVIR